MQHYRDSFRFASAMACLLAVATLGALAQQRTGQTPPQNQSQQPQNTPPGQTPAQPENQQPSQPAGSGMFSGFRRLSATGRTEEEETTVTAGAKGAKPGVGGEVGGAQPSADDRAQVTTIEQAEPTQQEMDNFFQEGQLSPAQKGASQ